MAISLEGTVKTPAGTPIEGAEVRLIGPEETLGDVRSAAVQQPGAVAWTREITGFEGHRWNCWQKYVMNQVSGITWAEFKHEVVEHNPILLADRFIFKADKTYTLPEQAATQPEVAWTRTVRGFSGNRWDFWQRFVQGKVAGVTWDGFKERFDEHNPQLRGDGVHALADQPFNLPVNVAEEEVIISWTRELTGFSGNRWQCWETHVRDQVDGLSWGEFKEQVLEHNPVLHADDYVFQPGKTYRLPENRREPLYHLFTRTDAAGHYSFEDLPTPGDCEVLVEADGYHPYHGHMGLESDTVHAHNVTLAAVGPRMKSLWAGYTTVPANVRTLIDQGLALLGDDPVVFDTLSPELQRLAFGSNFVNDPSDFHYKDIVCADLVTICLHAGGFDHAWDVTVPPGTPFNTSHAANYFRPAPNHPKLREVAENEEWLPGDILIYWNGDLGSNRVLHVNLYVGPFSGIDLSGNEYPESEGFDVVNASIDFFDPNEVEVGTATRPFTHSFCLSNRFGRQHVLRMRHVDVERELVEVDARGFVQVAGPDFVVDNRSFRFIGANVRGLVHYGGGDTLPHSRTEDVAIQLDAVRNMGANVVRVFLASLHLSPQDVADRLAGTLDRLANRNLYAIVAFTDVHGDTPFRVRGDHDRFYTQNGMLNKDFFTGGYRDNYLPFVRHIVSRFKDHKRIFAWELGNELKAWENIGDHANFLPEDFLSFASTVAREIRGLDPVHLISTGIINTGNLAMNQEQAERLYTDPNIDFVTVHLYPDDPDGAAEVQRANAEAALAQRLGKPCIIEEIGFQSGDRPAKMRQHLEAWFSQKGVKGFMQWGLMATHHDMGDGDSRFGMDRALHSDFDGLQDAFRNFADRLPQFG